MTTTNDGGSAFPVPGLSRDSNADFHRVLWPTPGMSLRAYIATQVLGHIATIPERLECHPDGDVVLAVEYADALIRALAKETT